MAMTQTVHAGEEDQHRAGQLHMLRLENFMCHENFEMTFGAHVNFISGTNGSGKSAVLQGIQACLGVRASDTGRSNSLNSFIKEGASQSLIAVTVFNTGEDAYQPELYGDFITVERRIGKQSGFVLKNASGHKVAQGRGALTLMLDALNLNASNPVAVLTQDTARTFLAGAASDKRKYDLFMEASLLEEISENYNASQAGIDAQKALLGEKHRELKESGEAMKELAKKVEDLQRVNDKRELSDMLTMAIAWQTVYQHDTELEKLRNKLEVIGPQRLKDAEAQHMDADAEAKVRAEELNAKKASVQGRNADISQLTRESTMLQNEHKQSKARVLEASKRVEFVQRELDGAYQQQKDVASSAAEEHQDMIESTQAAIAEFKQKLDSIQEESHQLATQEFDNSANIRELQALLRQTADEEDNLSKEVQRTRRAVAESEDELKQMRRSPADDVTRFFNPREKGPLKNLLQKIHAQKAAFHHPPIGPVGQHLSIEDEKWGTAVQAAIGGLLNKFIVHDSHDAEMLRRLAGQSGFDMNNFTCSVNRFDIPPHNIPDNQRPPPNVPTVLDMVKCKTPEVEAVVMNYLIDKAGVERVALAENYNAGKELAWGPQYRAVIGKVFLPDASLLYQKGHSQTHIAGGNARRSTLSRDHASATAAVERYISEQNDVLRGQHRRHKEVVNRKREVEASLRNAFSKQKQIKLQMSRLAGQRNDINTQRPEDLMPHEDAASMVEAQMQEINEQIFHLEQKKLDKERVLREAEVAEGEALAAFKVKKAESDQLKAKNDAWAQELSAEADAVLAATELAHELKKKLEMIQKKMGRLEDNKAQVDKDRREAEDLAKRSCAEPEGQAALEFMKDRYTQELGERSTEEEVLAKMAPDNMEAEARSLSREIQRHENRAGGTLEELQPKLEAEEKRFATKKRRYTEFKAPVKMLVEGLDTRRKRLKDMGRRIEAQVQTRFKHYMSMKGNVGTIKLNRAEGKLVMSVTMSNSKNEKAAGAVEDLKSLSGGEKSFTTVSFILALGEITENPFRAMDEFDVYMDAVNRRISMQSLIKFAYQLNHVQFLFLTPQDISAVEDAKRACQREGEMDLSDDFIKVVRMQAARENATQS